jgi:hypothetical protein
MHYPMSLSLEIARMFFSRSQLDGSILKEDESEFEDPGGKIVGRYDQCPLCASIGEVWGPQDDCGFCHGTWLIPV